MFPIFKVFYHLAPSYNYMHMVSKVFSLHFLASLLLSPPELLVTVWKRHTFPSFIHSVFEFGIIRKETQTISLTHT